MRSLKWFVVVLLLLGACGSGAVGGDGEGTPSGSAGSGSGSAAGDDGDDPFGNSNGENGPRGPLDGGAVADPSTGNDPLTDDNACAASSLAAEQVVVEQEVEVEVEVPVEVEVQVEVPVEVSVEAPVAMYVMFDKSQSMKSKLWTPAVSAMSGFLQSADSNGIDVALQYFPIDGGACSTGAGYKAPAVAVGRLPGNAAALVSSLDDEDANGFGTPIEGALRGVTEFCKTFQQNNANERCVAVLVTDGKPEFAPGCSTDDDTLAAIAGNAWTNFQVKTFAVGLNGADFTLLDKIATQGGAVDCAPNSARFACDISAGASQLSAALEKIRDTIVTTEIHTETHIETQIQTHTEIQTHMVTQQVALECEWEMPAAQAGVKIDPTRVNVRASGGEGGELALGRVPDLGHCADNGWYYDDNTAPTRLLACSQTCDAIRNQGHTAIDILLGCATKVLVVQ